MTGQTLAGPAQSLACPSRRHKTVVGYPHENVCARVLGLTSLLPAPAPDMTSTALRRGLCRHGLCRHPCLTFTSPASASQS